MSNFRVHLAGAVCAGLAVSVVACFFIKPTPIVFLQLFSIALFFGLFPDLDTDSIPRRWFYRFIVLWLLYLALLHKYELATRIALVSMLPLLSHHRGWTHSILAAIFVPIIAVLTYVFVTSGVSYNVFFALDNIILVCSSYMWFIIAASLGWLTHLLLDYR